MIDQHRRRSTSGRCWAAADRSSAARVDSLRVTPLEDEKKVRSFTACDDVYAWSPDWCRMAVNEAFAACVAGYGSHSFWTFNTSRWENIVDAADLS